MRLTKHLASLAPVLLTALIVCAAVPAMYAAAATPSSTGHVLAVDPEHSKMTVYVYKQGIFAFAADNHEIDAPIIDGSFDEAKHAVTIAVDAAKMRVLDPKMPADRRAKVQDKMVSADVLDVTHYPKIEFRATSIKPADAKHMTVVGDLTLHGRTHEVSVDVSMPDATHATGSATVRQTDFGITPIRIAGGTVRVKDDVKVAFELAFKLR